MHGLCDKDASAPLNSRPENVNGIAMVLTHSSQDFTPEVTAIMHRVIQIELRALSARVLKEEQVKQL
jgi:hypothetical protein